MVDLKQKIGKGLYDLRNEEGYSRQEFSDMAEISLNSYSSIENGQSLIKLSNLNTLLTALSINMSQFFANINL